MRETLCTLGNGRFAVRGVALGATADGIHYPGTYLAGGYNRLTNTVTGRPVENEDLVNWPNPLPILLRIEDGAWLRVAEDASDYRQMLDMRSGILTREMRVVDAQGRDVTLVERRLVSMSDPALAAVSLDIVAGDWSGRMTIRSLIDGTVTNAGVPRYRDLDGQHLRIEGCDHPAPGFARLRCRTVQSGIEAVFCARTRVKGVVAEAVETTTWAERGRVGTETSLTLEAGQRLRIGKTIAFATSRDAAIASPTIAATEAVERAGDFDALLEAHARVWKTLWDDFDIELEGDGEEAQRHLRLNLFHLLQTLSPHTAELDVGAPARGWHGEAYRGHIFWDELFIFRVLNLRAPRLTRALLRYRLRRLGAARRLAQAEGLPGAMYPWQSGSDGREETQTLHLNPKSGRWLADATHRQRHVGLGLAYNVWTYYRATDDLDFMIEGGAEMMIEIARLFAGLATWDSVLERYRIRGVMGPDEFHTAYPGRDPELGGGIDDNAYTNVLVAWVLVRAADALAHLPTKRRDRLCDALGLSEDELTRWQDIAERLHVPFLSNGLIAQFEGYEALEELDWAAYRERYGDIHRMDRILEAEGLDPNAYKVSKQADVLMLPFLFSAEELVQIFDQLGLRFDPADIPRLVRYYDARTSHGSTLSGVVQAWVIARSNREESWSLLREALRADIDDVQGGTTREGIHLGAMCGTIDIVQSGYLGLELRSGALHLNPVLPEGLTAIRTRLRYLGQDLDVAVSRTHLTIAAESGTGRTVVVTYRGRQRTLSPGGTATFRLVPSAMQRCAAPAARRT